MSLLIVLDESNTTLPLCWMVRSVCVLRGLGLWFLMPLIFQLKIVAISFIGRGNWSARRKPQTNFIVYFWSTKKIGRGPSNEHSFQIWFQLAQWFQRRRLKCKCLWTTPTNNGHQVMAIPRMIRGTGGLIKKTIIWYFYFIFRGY